MERELRKITIEDQELVETLQAKGKIIDEGREIAKQLEDLQERHQKLEADVLRHDEKVSQIIREKHLNSFQLQEFEEPHRIELKDGKVEVSIMDLIEDVKDRIREARKEAKKKSKKSK